MESTNLLRSKLYRPRASGDLVRRPRVCEILNRNLDRTVTLVCAPAGFGKTTLLSDWLADDPAPSAWLSLDQYDGDLDRFLTYFVVAVRSVFPSSCADTLALLRAPLAPPLLVLATTLVNDLDRLADDGKLAPGKRFVLVLDDYHLVRGKEVPNLIGALLQHPPRSLHLVISTRVDPPFSLHTLRARGELGEVRAQELRFTLEEIAAFMEQALGSRPDIATLSTLADRSEGWATGLRLAALTLTARGEVPDAAPEAAADNRYVLEYLLNEVLAIIPIATQDFLLKTAILDRLSGPLCDAVADRPGPDWDGRGYLEWLAGKNLFTFVLDGQGNWYRYHHLFRTLLQRRLERQFTKEDIVELHRRASVWYAQNGFIEESLHHALLAADDLAVIRLVEGHRHAAMNQEEWRRLEHWLSLIPRALIDSRPELLLTEAWLLQKRWQYGDLPHCLARIAALLTEIPLPQTDKTRLEGEVHALRSVIAYYASDAEGTRFNAARALELTPIDSSFVRSESWFYHGAAHTISGDLQGAMQTLRDGLHEDRLHANAFPARLYAGLCFVHWLNADFQGQLAAAAQMLQLGRRRELGEAIAWSHYHAGCAYYQLNRLDDAEEEFAAAFGQRYTAHDFAFSHGGFGLAAVAMAKGNFARAREIVDSIAAYALESTNDRILTDAEAFRALLDASTGRLAAARRWADSYDLGAPLVPMTTFHVNIVALARVLLQVGTPGSLDRAAAALEGARAVAESTGNKRVLIEALVLQALVHDASGHVDAALAKLKEGVLLAEPGGAIRIFVDLGPRLAGLLGRLAARGVAPGYLPTLLAECHEVEPVAPRPSSRPAPRRPGRAFVRPRA